MIFERFKNGIHQMTSMEPSAIYNLTMNKVHKVGGEADVEVTPTKVAMWDFETALGETIREKYAPEYVKVIEISNVILRQPIPPSGDSKESTSQSSQCSPAT